MVSPPSKATTVQEFPHGLSAWWIDAEKPQFVVYYAAIFSWVLGG
jgi:hypothetical protein